MTARMPAYMGVYTAACDGGRLAVTEGTIHARGVTPKIKYVKRLDPKDRDFFSISYDDIDIFLEPDDLRELIAVGTEALAQLDGCPECGRTTPHVGATTCATCCEEMERVAGSGH